MGDDWDPVAGVVRGQRAYRYRIPQGRVRRPAERRLVEWHHAHNPDQAKGDCVPMLMPLDLRQWLHMAGVVLREHQPTPA